ncbi:hypothetical protein [Lysobacter enzymogenes]|uniref:Uncharacterized protein n=1 Tax=Lysobacter enzymogenes TaxID=69 RepID=A0AAU9BAP6_LYSEN|nr:hypothetical protein [Lysobacter enzymogenes]BAW00002.1 hypothetical protein LEN_4514 [Lysobacter enzymogenes]
MIDPEHLRALGVPAERAERAAQAARAGDLRDLVHELLSHGLWSEVVDETQPAPQWIERWRAQAADGFPIIDAAALERLLAAGADPHDLSGVVRSAQILAIYNLAQLLDYPALALGWDLPEAATPVLACASEADAANARRLHPLHPELLERDPSGRFGEPCPLALRQWRGLPEPAREEIRTQLQAGHRSAAAALWKRHVGGEPRDCLDAVETLRRLLKDSNKR